jgi:hypothetical protein
MKRLFSFLLLSCALVYAVDSPLTEIHCQFKPIIRAHGKHHHGSQTGTSTNWSGYVAAKKSLTHPKKHAVTSVSGTWVVPTLVSSPQNGYSSVWVGIDGFGSHSVEQLGTEQDMINGTQQNYAWIEMYPHPAMEISGFPVNAGDQISASVTYTSKNTFTLSITNHTHSVTTSSAHTLANAERTSAEWIVEAPSTASGVLPLADYGSTIFTNCSATIKGVTGGINNSHWVYEAIYMENSSGTIISAPSALNANGTTFSVIYE